MKDSIVVVITALILCIHAATVAWFLTDNIGDLGNNVAKAAAINFIWLIVLGVISFFVNEKIS